MSRIAVRAGGVVLAALLWAAPASAQIVHSLHLGGGAFMPTGYSSRVDHDVLVKNLDSLEFTGCRSERFEDCIKDFNGPQAFAEWLIAFNNHVEVGASVGLYGRSTPSHYLGYTHPDESEIEQELRLRIIPVTGVVRLLAGRPGHVQPYFGLGVSALNYRYTESGEFVDFRDFSTFKNRYTAKGTAVGPVALAGLRIPIGGDIWGFTIEWRHQWGEANTGGQANGFLDDKIDLGGNHINLGVLVRF